MSVVLIVNHKTGEVGYQARWPNPLRRGPRRWTAYYSAAAYGIELSRRQAQAKEAEFIERASLAKRPRSNAQ